MHEEAEHGISRTALCIRARITGRLLTASHKSLLALSRLKLHERAGLLASPCASRRPVGPRRQGSRVRCSAAPGASFLDVERRNTLTPPGVLQPVMRGWSVSPVVTRANNSSFERWLAHLRVLDHDINTGGAAGKAFMGMLMVFSEFETNIRRERQMEAIEKAKKQ